MSQIYQESISVHSYLVGLVLGKRRINLKEIEEKYDVKVYLNQVGVFCELVIKSTLNDQLDEALCELENLIEEKYEFYLQRQIKKKEYQQKLARIKFQEKVNKLRKQNILEEVKEKPKELNKIKVNLNNNPFSLLTVSDSEEEEISEEETLAKSEYNLIDQSEIPPHTPTFSVSISCDDSSDSDDMICQKCIDEGRTSCPCS